MLVKVSGYEIRIFYDGLAVQEAAIDFRSHVVLLEIGLPGLNGFEVANRSRQSVGDNFEIVLAGNMERNVVLTKQHCSMKNLLFKRNFTLLISVDVFYGAPLATVINQSPASDRLALG